MFTLAHMLDPHNALPKWKADGKLSRLNFPISRIQEKDMDDAKRLAVKLAGPGNEGAVMKEFADMELSGWASKDAVSIVTSEVGVIPASFCFTFAACGLSSSVKHQMFLQIPSRFVCLKFVHVFDTAGAEVQGREGPGAAAEAAVGLGAARGAVPLAVSNCGTGAEPARHLMQQRAQLELLAVNVPRQPLAAADREGQPLHRKHTQRPTTF